MKGTSREFSFEGIRVETSELIQRSLLVPICQNFVAQCGSAFPLSRVSLRDLGSLSLFSSGSWKKQGEGMEDLGRNGAGPRLPPP